LRLLRVFLLREWAKGPYEENELPTVVALCLVGITPRGHSRQFDAIFNDVIDLAVCESLCLRGAQIGHARIKRLAYRSQRCM
jgi:hypothetical protein